MKLENYKYGSNFGRSQKNITWPLYGAGLVKLGKNGKPVVNTLREYKPNELLIRHDAVGLCFTDVKEITYGDQHPRLIGRNLAKNPIIPGHEASMTVIAVGDNLKDEYKVGDRFVIQPDVWYGGKSIPYSFGMDGAYRQYGVIGKEILNGDEGNYLIPVPDTMSYAGAALTEPWACVEAAYRMTYRTEFGNGGIAWFLGSGNSRSGYCLRKILNKEHKPARIFVTDIPDYLIRNLRHLAEEMEIECVPLKKDAVVRAEVEFDDIVVLDGDAADVDNASPKLAKGGILAILRERPMSAPIKLDFGRIHYDHILYVGTTGLNIDEAYQGTPVRSSLKLQGTTLIMGSGGPMGRMHLQRALESSQGPNVIVATDIDVKRLSNIELSFRTLIDRNRKEMVIINPCDQYKKYQDLLSQIMNEGGFDDVEVMITDIEAIVNIAEFVSERGMINLFAGLKRGTMASVDAWHIYGPRQIRYIGHSGSKLSDQIAIVDRFKNGELQPHRSMAALCGMNQIAEGINAMMNSIYQGKIVVYPMVPDFPLTGLAELKHLLPQVYDLLENGSSWTNEAEAMFLESMLPD